MTTSSPFNLSDPIEFLELVKRTLSPDKLRPLLADIDEGFQTLSSVDRSNSQLFVTRVAQQLRSHPKLFHQFNCLIHPRFRLECSLDAQQVNYFVLVDQEAHKSRIVSLANIEPSLPSSNQDFLNIIRIKSWWENLLASDIEKAWLECVAQVLQEILDDPGTDDFCRTLARKRLGFLAKARIVPPSLFLQSATANIAAGNSFDPSMAYIASGGNCDVYRASVKGITVCFRVLRQSEASDKERLRADFCRELTTWRQLSHPNVISLIGASLDAFPGRFCFVLPWMSHGSIMSYLRRHPNHDRFVSICQIANGVDYLHDLKPPVSHKDIKGANVLVRPDLVCVLTDFGLATFVDSQRSRGSDGGTIPWMAPELFEKAPLSKDSLPRDVYSFGCTMAEIMGADIKGIMLSVIRRETPCLPPPERIWSAEQQDVWCFVLQCLQPDPLMRPTIRMLRNALQDIRKIPASPSLSIRFPTPRSPPNISHIREWIRQQQSPIDKPQPHFRRTRGLLTPTTPNYPAVELESSGEYLSASSAKLRLVLKPHLPAHLVLVQRRSGASGASLPTPPDSPAPPSPRLSTPASPIRARRPSLGRPNAQAPHIAFSRLRQVSLRSSESPLRHSISTLRQQSNASSGVNRLSKDGYSSDG